MEERFLKALNFVFSLEGGYSNHKADRGGATNYGITQGTYNAYRRSVNKNMQPVELITKEEATDIYYKEYWLKSGANKIYDFGLALMLFDSCVNHGLKTGVELYRESGKDLEKFFELRKNKYRAIVMNNPSQRVFIKGWFNRLHRLEKFIKEQENW